MKHDAMHLPFPMENRTSYFEWWDFDAEPGSGDYVLVMYSTNVPRLSRRQPTMGLNIYAPDGGEISELGRYSGNPPVFTGAWS
ncbi:hypothetical protein Q4543_09290 [Salipiger sp. 1_MG-2023]|uniref:hypothetical protein n=1 Tax=Salipiger sp. 1_MG-2023 TaxID=3062665 RepID=UPI0026E2C9A3|nr:hypothetical protein [Salipiger sp. 1_MG-2023]MDO6585714.1 hypothetical protein [Salipiger sp. 1_MG-2023]